MIAFGDIHGECSKVRRLIRTINPSSDDTLIFLGDYVDRGPEIFETIEYMLELNEKYNCVFLSGNHDYSFKQFLGGVDEEIHIRISGNSTIDSYINHGYDINPRSPWKDRIIPESHKNFFDNLFFFHETDDFIFVHAGIDPNIEDMRDQDIEFLCYDRDFVDVEYGEDRKTVVFGHTAFFKPFVKVNKIGVDTGAVYEEKGVLTAVKLPERIFYQTK